MKPDPQEPAAMTHLLRQQLILAQTRIMDLEDQRDELAPRLAEASALLGAAQVLAERKVEEAAHLEQVRADLQAQFEHMRHMQHVTNEALNAARAELAAGVAREQALLAEAGNLHLLTRQLAEAGRAKDARIQSLDAELQAAHAESGRRLQRLTELDGERRALKSSRSWRWTAWLRAVERLFK